MPWVPDSKSAGYLGPAATPSPLSGDPWANFLQEVVAGITGIDPTLCRPLWQPEPVNMPGHDTSWVAVGVSNTSFEWQPAIQHRSTGDGYDEFRRHEEVTVQCTFYGPDAPINAGLLRDGLNIDQNRAALRSADVAFVAVGDFTRNAEMIQGRWVDRIDTILTVRRGILRTYPVLNLLSAKGVIQAEPPYGSERLIETDIDTDDEL